MSVRRNVAIVGAAGVTALFVLGWLGLSGVLPSPSGNPIDAITGASHQLAPTPGDPAADSPLPQAQDPGAAPQPWWQFGGYGDGDHHERHHRDHDHDHSDDRADDDS